MDLQARAQSLQLPLLKEECRLADLNTSGTRFDLTLQLLQLHVSGPAAAGVKKRAADVELGTAAHPAKVSKPSPPNIPWLVLVKHLESEINQDAFDVFVLFSWQAESVSKKVFPDTDKWSNMKFKLQTGAD